MRRRLPVSCLLAFAVLTALSPSAFADHPAAYQGEFDPDELDRSDIESRLDEARRARDEAEEGSEERNRYERNIQRYEAFLEVASS